MAEFFPYPPIFFVSFMARKSLSSLFAALKHRARKHSKINWNKEELLVATRTQFFLNHQFRFVLTSSLMCSVFTVSQ
jgi:hypothetical protein